MNKSPPVQESSYFIHQRYEDTSQLIFQQIQKKKKDLSHGKHGQLDGAGNDVEFTHYGNPGVVARSEAADWLAVYNDKSLKKKGKEEKKKKEKEKGKSPKGTPEKPVKTSKSRPVVPQKYTPLPSPGQVRHNFSPEVTPREGTPREVTPPEVTPREGTRREVTPPEVAPPEQQVISEDKDQLVYTPNKKSPSTVTNENKDQLAYSPNKKSPITVTSEDKEQLAYSPNKKSPVKKQEPFVTSTLVKRRGREDSQVQDGSLGRSKFVQRKDLNPTNLQTPSPDKTLFVPRSDASPPNVVENSHSSFIPRASVSSPDTSSNQSSFVHSSERGLFDFEAVADNLKETHFGPDVDSVPNSPIDSSSESNSDDDPQSQDRSNLEAFEQKSPADVDDGVVDFGHYGNTGVIATKEAVAKSTFVTTKNSNTVESKICRVM